MADNERNELNRRDFLRKAAITGAVAWAVPVIQSVAATPAYAQTQTPVTPQCEHSPPNPPAEIAGEDCMSTCKAACGTASGCGNICCSNRPGCPCTSGVCCANACNPAAWSCVGGSPVFAGC